CDVHDAVAHDRRALERIFRAEPGAEVHHPGALESLDVVAIDLRQGRIAAIAPIAADREPLAAGRLAQVRRLLGEASGWQRDGGGNGQADTRHDSPPGDGPARLPTRGTSGRASRETMPQLVRLANAVRRCACSRSATLLQLPAAGSLEARPLRRQQGFTDGP